MLNIATTQGNCDTRALVGVGLKAEHYRTIVETLPRMGFFEVHAENYMGAGGPPHRYLSAVREHYPLSLHGVGLSIGASRPLDRDHLQRLKTLIDRYTPMLFSEHLAWSTHHAGFLNDLLPIPYTDEALDQVIDHIDQIQETLGLQLLLENPSTYLAFAENSYSEIDFITEVVRKTGCGLLLDVNNVYVASTNHGRDPTAYLDAYPHAHVREIHLAGYSREADENGYPLLIDTHDRSVDDAVWGLYAHAIGLIGPVPTLIEWDADVPDWSTLSAEALRAELILSDAISLSHASRNLGGRSDPHAYIRFSNFETASLTNIGGSQHASPQACSLLCVESPR